MAQAIALLINIIIKLSRFSFTNSDSYGVYVVVTSSDVHVLNPAL
jgi:hypothetical protein